MINVSVIILCHNNKNINTVINSVLPQLNDEDEIFVVDDHSNQDVRKLLEGYNQSKVQILIPSTNGNRAANRNFAANIAKGDLFVFIDGDVVLRNNAISSIKSYNYDGIAGVCGSVAAMRMTPEVVAIHTHNYFEPIVTNELDFATWHEKFPDVRNRERILAWNRFYTALSIIPRDKFFIIGGFDETFMGWGGEDIDIGYRLSFYGQLLISKDIQAIHIPHDRNVQDEEITSRQNMYKMLEKYRNRDMEELLSFALTPYVTEAIDNVLSTLRKFDGKVMLNQSENDLVYYPVSSNDPNGKIVYYEGKIKKEEEFLGFALPFADCCFENVVTTTFLFDYPEGMSTRILQELLRVSKRVIIKKVESHSVEWEEIENKFRYIFCYYKTYLFADSYQDFLISDKGTHYLIKRTSS